MTKNMIQMVLIYMNFIWIMAFNVFNNYMTAR